MIEVSGKVKWQSRRGMRELDLMLLPFVDIDLPNCDETTLNAIQNEKFDPESAICPTCGQHLPEEQVERLKTEFEQKKQEMEKLMMCHPLQSCFQSAGAK